MCVLYFIGATTDWLCKFPSGRQMETSSQPLPPLSPCPTTLGESLPFSPSPKQTCSNGCLSLPVSPFSFPSSPSSFSPTTADAIHSSSPLSHFVTSQCLEEQNIQCLSPVNTSDQDDLTCLSWLHQRGNLLPLQPLHKMTPLPRLDSSTCVQPPASSKPPYSFSCLIFMAIEDSPDKRLPVKDIYEWIINNFPYYRTAAGGWRNSVRHNLSLSKSFRRIQRDKVGARLMAAPGWCSEWDVFTSATANRFKQPQQKTFAILKCLLTRHWMPYISRWAVL